MRVRRIAVLIDGAFFLKRLPKLVEPGLCTTPQQVTETARLMCKRHVMGLTHAEHAGAESSWLDHVYRIFYYDAEPFDGVVHHPLLNRRMDFGRSELALFRRALFAELRRERKFALRLGHVSRDSEWSISPRLTRHVLKIGRMLEHMDTMLQKSGTAAPDDQLWRELREVVAAWRVIGERDVILGLRQKGVDMRIGLDIASMTLKHQVDTILLVTGDSDFVPAAKLARREGVEFLLDPLWQKISEELTEHVDGVVSVFAKPVNQNQSLMAA